MKGTFLAGVILIIIGIVALVYQGFSYTQRERVVDLGPLKVDADKQHNVWVPPVVGIAFLVGGIACMVVGGRRTV